MGANGCQGSDLPPLLKARRSVSRHLGKRQRLFASGCGKISSWRSSSWTIPGCDDGDKLSLPASSGRRMPGGTMFDRKGSLV
jgi:hypothetical protein